MKELVGFDSIKDRIYTVRGQKVMLDRDLAALYGVTTGNLNLAVKRNISRFPSDFMFQLTKSEWENLSLQFAILNTGRGQHRKYLPYVFTEHGVSMISGLLNSKIAIDVNILIIRAFVALRRVVTDVTDYGALQNRVTLLESRFNTIQADAMVNGLLNEKKLNSLSSDVRRISQVLDSFQDGYVVIKRPEEGATFD